MPASAVMMKREKEDESALLDCWTMSTPGLELCGRAIAYLMAPLPAAEATVKPSELECPVITDLTNGLLIGYLADQGSHFQYVQQRHLADANWTEPALHKSSLNNLAMLLRKNGAPYGRHTLYFSAATSKPA